MKHNYVRIETVYQNRKDLNIEYLSKQYDEQLLVDKIRVLLGDCLDERVVSGKKILIKPNWVKHNTKVDDEWCLCTNERLILATLKLVLERKPVSVVIADAPIQGCDWNKLLSKNFLQKCEILSRQYGISVYIKDFRKVIYDSATNEVVREEKSDSDYIIFDMGKDSFLEPITKGRKEFRVNCYNPDELAKTHYEGVHKYCIAKDVFEADVILTMPKMKTHQKAGVTNAMKILVGVNGDKAYLPHHRIGAKGYGGDCYPGKSWLRSISEWVLDNANRRIGESFYKTLLYVSAVFWKLSKPSKEQNLAAAWYGNDTVWRMVMDLNHIAMYGRLDGSLCKEPQRVIYSLCDGIIGGQGNGPLSPEPLPLGVLAFSNNSYWMDLIMGKLFSLKIDKIPNLRVAKQMLDLNDCELIINRNVSVIDDLDALAVQVKMPPGWVNYEKAEYEK